MSSILVVRRTPDPLSTLSWNSNDSISCTLAYVPFDMDSCGDYTVHVCTRPGPDLRVDSQTVALLHMCITAVHALKHLLPFECQWVSHE